MTGEINRIKKTLIIPATLMTAQPDLNTIAPINPPMMAWDAELGIPRNQVSSPQIIALASAASKAVMLTAPGSTIPPPMVLATATPKMKGPENSAMATSVSDHRGESALEEIMVATMLLESWIPFKKSKPKPNTNKAVIVGIIDEYYPFFMTILAITLAASSPRSAALLRWR